MTAEDFGVYDYIGPAIQKRMAEYLKEKYRFSEGRHPDVPGSLMLAARETIRAHSPLVPTEITVEELNLALRKQVSTVKELDFIAQEAKKLGVRVWLFGGSAAMFAHYVREDLLSQKGNSSFPRRNTTISIRISFMSLMISRLWLMVPSIK